MAKESIQQLVEEFADQDPELKSLWEEHVLFEKQVEKLESKRYRTPAEEQELKILKKQKLDGKTRLHEKIDSLKAQKV